MCGSAIAYTSMNLHPKELQLIAALPQEPGFQLLCQKILAYIDELTDDLHHADAVRTNDLLPYWRALKTIYTELVVSPQNLGKQLKEDGQIEPAIENDPKTNKFLAQVYRQAQEKEDDLWAEN